VTSGGLGQRWPNSDSWEKVKGEREEEEGDDDDIASSMRSDSKFRSYIIHFKLYLIFKILILLNNVLIDF